MLIPSANLTALHDCPVQKYSRLRCLLCVKGLVICFYLGWSGSILQLRQNIIKVGSKSWLLTCSSNITLSLPSYIDSALKRERTFCNRYLSQLYFCMQVPLTENIAMSKCCMDTNSVAKCACRLAIINLDYLQARGFFLSVGGRLFHK